MFEGMDTADFLIGLQNLQRITRRLTARIAMTGALMFGA
jgi:hypothetical protein